MTQNRIDWTPQKIRDLTQRIWKKRACWLQIKIAQAIYAGKDVVSCAKTGAGKTLSFFIALAMAIEDGQDKMIFIVTPLNLLGKQNVEALGEAGMPAISVSAENASVETFKDIAEGKYRAVIINPELLMDRDEVMKLWTKVHLTNRLLYLVFDEGHCINQWAKFRKNYLRMGDLRFIIPVTIPFYVASATLPTPILADITKTLRLRSDTVYIMRSNDRPEIRLMVRGLGFPASSFKDLMFLIPNDVKYGDPGPSPAKFLVFFDNTKEAEAATKYLCNRLPRSLRKKVRYFHSTMTQAYRDDELQAFRRGETWGMCCTDAFGMGMDLADIEVVVQWKATCDMCTLWQRFGRAARGPGREGTAILLVEKKDIDEERVAKAERAAKRKEKALEKRKAEDQGGRSSKRPVLTDRNTNATAPTIGPTVAGHSADRQCGNVEMIDSDAMVAEEEERRAHYLKVLPDLEQNMSWVQPKGKSQAKLEVGSVMDDYINAPGCIKCRRTIPRLYFGNDKTPTNDHLLCDPSQPTGCTRCAPRATTICCDLCHPSFFKQFTVTAESQTRAPSKSHIKRCDSMDSVSLDLTSDLRSWRQRAAITKFGTMSVRRFGAKLLMSDQTLDRLVLCARASKLATMDHLLKETSWKKDWVDEFGEEILRIVHRRIPQALPLGSSMSAVETGPVQRTCSNSNCPARVAEREKAHKATSRSLHNENVPPATRPQPRRLPQRPASYSSSVASSALSLTPQPQTPSESHPLPQTATPSYSLQPLTPSRPLLRTPQTPLPLCYQRLLTPSRIPYGQPPSTFQGP
ncbi:hypothetical protein H0H92_004013 [Tricholoma furcatifolium]|nr:hypothetical protein H0H92_004013 [Tricholoma furcatifolium]